MKLYLSTNNNKNQAYIKVDENDVDYIKELKL